MSRFSIRWISLFVIRRSARGWRSPISYAFFVMAFNECWPAAYSSNSLATGPRTGSDLDPMRGTVVHVADWCDGWPMHLLGLLAHAFPDLLTQVVRIVLG